MTWKPDLRTEKHYGPFTVVSETNADRETAHLLIFPDDRQVRVLPDGSTSGRKRAYLVQESLEGIAKALGGADRPLVDPVVYLRGVLAGLELSWQEIDPNEVSIEEWLTEWFGANDVTAQDLIDDLATDGWEITRKGEE